jgi:hypothetical protein
MNGTSEKSLTSVKNIFTSRHVDLLREMDQQMWEKLKERETSTSLSKMDPRRQRLLGVNRLILDECLAHQHRMEEMRQHHLTSLAQEAKQRKKQGSDAAKMHICGSYVPELSAFDMLSVVMHTVASLCDAEGIAIFVGSKLNDPMGSSSSSSSSFNNSRSRNNNSDNNNDNDNDNRRARSPSGRRASASSFDIVMDDVTVGGSSLHSSSASSSLLLNNSGQGRKGGEWRLLCGFDRRASRHGPTHYYVPAGSSPGPRFRKRIGSRVLTKDSVELETLGSGREVMCMSIRNVHARRERHRRVASTYRRRGSISGSVTAGALLGDGGVGGDGISSGEVGGVGRGGDIGTWDTAVVQLIRAEPFASGDEQVLLAAREHLHGSIWQTKLEDIEERLSSNLNAASPSSSRKSSPVNGRNSNLSASTAGGGSSSSSSSTSSSSSSSAPYSSAHRIHHPLQMRVCNVTGIPWWDVERTKTHLHRKASAKLSRKAPTKVTENNSQTVIVRARVYHGNTPLSSAPATTRQLPFHDDITSTTDKATPDVASSSNNGLPTHQGLFMLSEMSDDNSGDDDGDDDGDDNDNKGERGDRISPLYKNEPARKAQRSSVVSQTSSIFARKEAEMEDALGPPSFVQAQWYDWIDFRIPVQDVPRAAKIVFEVLTTDGTTNHHEEDNKDAGERKADRKHRKGEKRIGWTVLPLYGLDQVMRHGRLKLHLFPGDTYDVGLSCMYNGMEGGDLERTLVHNALYQRGTDDEAASRRQQRFASHHVPSWWNENCCTTLNVEMFRHRSSSGRDRITVYRDRIISRPAAHSHHNVGYGSSGLSPDVIRILSSRSPMVKMSAMDKRNLWFARDTLTQHPSALVHVLRCVDWSRYEQVQEMYALLRHWSPLPSSIALNLLGPETSDPNVRAFAVRQLETLNDAELNIFMLHLTHALKFETFVDSSLSRFLVRRALLAPATIGHAFFWSLKSEMSMQEGLAVRQRFGVVISQYLQCCGSAHRTVLGHSLWLMERLTAIAKLAKRNQKKKSKERTHLLHQELKALNRSMPKTGVRLPLSTTTTTEEHQSSSSISSSSSSSPSRNSSSPNRIDKGQESSNQTSKETNGTSRGFMVTGVVVEKCKVMSSKKAPLWLVFKIRRSNGTIGATTVLFKDGDDLRQDQLTIAVMRVVERCWSGAGLDLQMMPYGCQSKCIVILSSCCVT